MNKIPELNITGDTLDEALLNLKNALLTRLNSNVLETTNNVDDIVNVSKVAYGSCPKPKENGDKEGESRTTFYSWRQQDALNPGMSKKVTISKKWYWHNGSQRMITNFFGYDSEKIFEADWYDVSDYKEIMTGTSAGATKFTPLMARTLVKDVLGNKDLITEKDLTVEELLALRQVVLRAMRKGKIEYIDYATTKGGDQYSDVAGNSSGKGYGKGYSIMNKIKDPYYALKTTLGQASIVKEDGEIYVTDTYDFNDAQKAQEGKGQIEIFKAYWKGIKKANEAESMGKKVYSHARNVGTHYGSWDGKGIPVKIKVPFIK